MINFYEYYVKSFELDHYTKYSDDLKKCTHFHFYKSTYDYSNIIHIIQKDPSNAGYYAELVIKRRWPEAEQYIATSAIDSFEYARRVVKGPWKEGEAAIMGIPGLIYHYAQDIIKGRWLEAEHIIKRTNMWKKEYETAFGIEL